MSASPKKIALVTGANKGIGFEVSRQLAKAGFHVLLGARNLEAGKLAAQSLTAEGLSVEAIQLDLLDRDSIAEAAASVEKCHGHLDILINNAGIVAPGDGPPAQASLDALQTIFQTNFFGAVAVTQHMLPLLRKASAARIVNVSSGLGSLAQNGDPDWPYVSIKALGYCSSKAALNMLTVQLAWELRDTAIKVNSADPGYTATDLNHNSGHQTIEQGAAETVRLALLPADGPSGGFFATEGLVPW